MYGICFVKIYVSSFNNRNAILFGKMFILPLFNKSKRTSSTLPQNGHKAHSYKYCTLNNNINSSSETPKRSACIIILYSYMSYAGPCYSSIIGLPKKGDAKNYLYSHFKLVLR